MTTIGQIRDEVDGLWSTMTIDPRVRPKIVFVAKAILAEKPALQRAARLTGVPWPLIGCLQYREADLHETGRLAGRLRMDCHLHNGDPLTGWTTHDPAHRPGNGSPPFAWIVSALDALRRLSSNQDWSIAGIAWAAESYNGFGYRARGLRSPYVWSWCNHAVTGKYTSDHKFDPAARDAQVGVMPLLSVLMDLDPSIQPGGLTTACRPGVIDAVMTHPKLIRLAATAAAPLLASPTALALPAWAVAPLIGAVAGAGLVGLAWVISEVIAHHAALRRVADA